jgi:hypothetical protein
MWDESELTATRFRGDNWLKPLFGRLGKVPIF